MRLQETLPTLRVVAPMANAAARIAFEEELANAHRESRIPNPVLVIDSHAHEAMIAADAILLASGTASLEAMLAKRPMVVAYRISALTYRIVTAFRMLETNRYSLPNTLAGRDLVPEIMQDEVTPDALAAALRPALQERRVPMPLLAEYRHLHLELRRDASRSAAAAIAALIGPSRSDAPA